jgi:2-C-methyl-D-erythritol 4-phosphate cytidylyltransferase
MRVGAIILAAGAGRRFGGRVPKTFQKLLGKPLFLHCLPAFRSAAERVLVVPPGRLDWVVGRFGRELVKHVTALVEGGERRQDSVERGLAAISDSCDVVLVHDSARPFVTPALVMRVAAAAARWGAAVPGLPLRDTVKQVRGHRVVSTPDRASLVAVQTPQGVRTGWLREAYRQGASLSDATDDVQLVERLGRRVVVVAGEPHNLKITSRGDVAAAEYIQASRHGR